MMLLLNYYLLGQFGMSNGTIVMLYKIWHTQNTTVCHVFLKKILLKACDIEQKSSVRTV